MILTIDLGSTNLKTAIINKKGKIEKFDRRPSSLDLTFLKKFCEGFSLLGLAISTQGPTFVALDKDNKLIDAFYYHQNNAEVQQFNQSGYPSAFLPQMTYFIKTNVNAKKISKLLTIGDYIAYVISGVLQTSLPNNNADNLAYLWNDEKIGAYGLSKNLFVPSLNEPIYSNVDFLGVKIPILNITFDFFTMPFGLPYPNANFAFNRTGTSEGINFIYAQKPEIDPSIPSRITKYPIDNYYTVGYVQNNVLATFEKIRYILNFTTIDKLLHQSENFLSQLNTETKKLLADYIANYDIPINIHQKANFNKIYAVGGLSTSPWLNQYKANYWQKPIITLANHETELIGLAVQVYLQLGVFSTIEEALNIFVKEDKIYYPQ